jgi:hypothetical protein
MARINPGSSVDHDFAAAWIEHMKGVYQQAINKHAASGLMEASDIIKARNHLKALAVLQKMLSEHHEMAQGQSYDAGDIGFGLRTIASLIKPNGEIIPIKRKEK